MALTVRFREMNKRLSELRKHFLPKKFSPTGIYSERQLDQARGYRLLVHAEIESYLEDISRETITNAVKNWKLNKKPSVVIVSFITSYHSSWSATEEINQEEIIQLAKNRPNAKDSINNIMDIAQIQFIQKVKDNHGIKDKNLKTLILPVGIDIKELDQTWLTNLDNFGNKRGEIAHKTIRTTSLINPEDELNSVNQLLIGLKDLDNKIELLRAL